AARPRGQRRPTGPEEGDGNMSRRGSKPKKNPATGQYEIRVDTAPAGARRRQVWVRGKTLRECQSAVNELLVGVDQGTHVDKRKLTVKEWADSWLAGLPATGLRARTVAFYADMTGHLVKHIGDARLQSLLGTDLNACYVALGTEGRRAGRGLSAATVRKVHITAHKMFEEAKR